MGVQVLAAGSAPSWWSGNAALISTDADVIRVNADAAATARVDVGAVGPGSKAGILLGDDVNWYRSAAGTMKSDATTVASGNYLVAFDGGAHQVVIGIASFGEGVRFGIADDTVLYRKAANQLATDDLFTVLGIAATSKAIGASGYIVGSDGDSCAVRVGKDGTDSAVIFGAGLDTAIARITTTGQLRFACVAGIMVGHNNATLLGFFGTAPVAQPTGVAVTAAGIHAALVSLGLITA